MKYWYQVLPLSENERRAIRGSTHADLADGPTRVEIPGTVCCGYGCLRKCAPERGVYLYCGHSDSVNAGGTYYYYCSKCAPIFAEYAERKLRCRPWFSSTIVNMTRSV